jgi:polyhydroxybutyrate depolymerase
MRILFSKFKYSDFVVLFISFILIAQSCIFSQISSYTIQHDGMTREYDLYVPAIYNSTVPVPLLFNLHGYTSSKEAQTVYGDFRPIADTANFIIVHPNGTFDASNQRWWNAFGFALPNDVDFLITLVNEISQNFAIDLDRVYSTGMSNGGFMSFELACEASNVFTAVASVTGAMPATKLNNCSPNSPIPSMQIHGTLDAVVPYNGNIQYASIENVVEFWVEQVEANETPLMVNLPDIDPNDGSTVEQYVYENGINGSSIEHYKVINGGHTWPGSAITLPTAGNTNQDFNASKEIWRFFSQYTKSDLLSVAAVKSDLKISVFPNPSSGIVNILLPQGIKNMQIIDGLGRVILKENLIETDYTINLEKGVYILQVSHDGVILRRKIIVQ